MTSPAPTPDAPAVPAKKMKNYTTLGPNQLRWPHKFAQWVSIRILDILFKWKFHFVVRGKENQPKRWSSYVVAANHTSNFDPPFVSVALDFQPISYMAKIELYQTPILRIYNIAMASFAVNRDKLELSTVKTALRVLKDGQWALGIFPEGTRHKNADEQLVGSAKRGVAYFARAGNVPVLPLGIYQQGKRVYVNIGEPIPPEKDLDILTEKIQASIAALVEKGRLEDMRYQV